MIAYRPVKIYLDPAVKNSPITQNILAAFPTIPVEETDQKPEILNEIEQAPDPLLEGKKRLWITRNKGRLVKKCGASTSALNQLVCCNYFVLDFSFNCHFECVYCFLQEYTNLPMMVVYANIEEMLASLQNLLASTSSQTMRIGTGEMADSLALDHMTGFSHYLVPFFAKQKKGLLELKTKSDCVDRLLEMDPRGRTVIAWSMNPPAAIEAYDLKTASLEARLDAADRCQRAGYKIAFHLDPLIYEPAWQKDYGDLIKRLYSRFDPAWVSLGGLRFNANLKAIIQKRFPKTRLTTGEFVTTPDGKKRYLRAIREEMYQAVHRMIQARSPQTPTYLCMENSLVWQNTMGFCPATEQALEKHIVGKGDPLAFGSG